MSDVLQMLCNGIADRYLVLCDSQFVHQVRSVCVCAVTCTEPRHSDTNHTLAVVAKLVGGKCRNQKCQRGIQAATDADNQRLTACMLPTMPQTGGLDGYDIRAVFILIAFCGQERCWRERTVQRLGHCIGRPFNRCYGYLAVVTMLVFSEIGISLPVGAQTLHIHFLNNHRRHSLETVTCRKDITVLGNIGRTGEHHIRRRFA